MSKEKIGTILGKEKYITLTYEEYNELYSAYEKGKKQLEREKENLKERELRVSEWEDGLIQLVEGEPGSSKRRVFITKDEALVKMKESMEEEYNKKLRKWKEEIEQKVRGLW